MKKTIFIILFASLFTECNKSKDDFSANLIGEWSWIKSCGGIGGTCYTPGTTNKNDRIVFTANSLYYLYRNDTLKLTRNFTTYQVTTKFKSTRVNIVEFDRSGILYSFSVRHDTLVLNDYSMSDGFTDYYKRIY
jgi:hypothetical protein